MTRRLNLCAITSIVCFAFCTFAGSKIEANDLFGWQEDVSEEASGTDAKVAQKIKKVGGQVSLNKQGKIGKVSLPKGTSNPESRNQSVSDLMGDLAQLDHLEFVVLGGDYVNDMLLDSISAQLPDLRKLRLEKCNNITDAGIFTISRMQSLQYFYFDGGKPLGSKTPSSDVRASGKSLEYIAKNSQITELIFVATMSTTDADIAHLAKMPQLTKLSIGWSEKDKITDNGIAHLSGLTNLSSLSVHLANITENSLDHIAGLENLEILFLTATDFAFFSGSKIMATMDQLKNVKKLNLGYTTLTPIQIRSLLESHELSILVITTVENDRESLTKIESEYKERMQFIRVSGGE